MAAVEKTLRERELLATGKSLVECWAAVNPTASRALYLRAANDPTVKDGRLKCNQSRGISGLFEILSFSPDRPPSASASRNTRKALLAGGKMGAVNRSSDPLGTRPLLHKGGIVETGHL